MKKILCIVFALLMCMVVLFSGCGNTPTGGVVDQSGNDDVNTNIIHSDNKIEEGVSIAEEELGAGVEAFVSGKFYLEGVVYTEIEERGTKKTEVMPLILSQDGKNYQITANYSGISLSMLLLDGKTYIVLPRDNQYAELSESLITMLDLDQGLGVNDFQSIAQDSEGVADAAMSQLSVTINGQPGLCTVYQFSDVIYKLYSIGDTLIQIENYDLDGTMTAQIAVDEISAQIPSDQLTLKGLEASTPSSFLKALTNSISF